MPDIDLSMAGERGVSDVLKRLIAFEKLHNSFGDQGF